jgi:PGF-CTERM protein
MMRKIIIMVIILVTMFAGMANAVTIHGPRNPETCSYEYFDLPVFPSHPLYTCGLYSSVFGGFSKSSYDGTWVGNMSYGGKFWFNVSGNRVRTFGWNYTKKEVPFDIIDSRTGEKVGNGTCFGSNPTFFRVNATIVNNQFNYTRSESGDYGVTLLGVFTSDNSASGTCDCELSNFDYTSCVDVYPLFTWNATKIHIPAETSTPIKSPKREETESLPPTPTPEETPKTPPTPTKEVPGFEAILAIAGLLAVTYLLRRRK